MLSDRVCDKNTRLRFPRQFRSTLALVLTSHDTSAIMEQYRNRFTELKAFFFLVIITVA